MKCTATTIIHNLGPMQVSCNGEMMQIGHVSTKSMNWGIEKEKYLYQCEICKTIKLV